MIGTWRRCRELGRGRFPGLLTDKALLDLQIRLFFEVLREIAQGANANRIKSKSLGELLEPGIVMFGMQV